MSDDRCRNGEKAGHRAPIILHSAFCISSASRGQALIESCIVIGLICLLLMGIFQLAQLFLAREILDYAAGRGARAKAVGFNDFMVEKTVHIGSIVNAGRISFPELPAPRSPLNQWNIERGLIPLYLHSDLYGQLDSILVYEDWDTIHTHCPNDQAAMLHFETSQDLPVRIFPAVFQAFYADTNITLRSSADIENHSLLYLQ